jgi:hypothetical protein
MASDPFFVIFGALILCLLLVSTSFARQGVVTLVSDQRYIGDIDASDPEHVVVNSHGVQITIDRVDIRAVEYLDQMDQDFKDKMARLSAVDVPGRLDIAKWAMDLNRLDLALAAADQAANIAPDNKDALALRLSIIQQISGEHPTTLPDAPPPPESLPSMALVGNATTLPAPVINPVVHPVLSADDIQEVRRNELKITDVNVRFRFDNDVRKRFALAQGIDATLFSMRAPIEQAVAIIITGDKSMATDVKVLTDPSAILVYKQRVQPLVALGCATSGCHGGPSGGALYMYSAPDNESQLYTNFYALESYAREVQTSGPFGSGPARRQMIDRTSASDSLLLQFCLPPALAQNPHPPAALYNGYVRSTEDPRYLAIQSWISDALNPLDPTYDIPRPILHRANAASTTTRPSTMPSILISPPVILFPGSTPTTFPGM